MPWSVEQRKRLGFEKELLESYFHGRVTWVDPTGSTKVEVKVTCSNDKEYELRIYLPEDYPNSCPEMIVSSPGSCLITYGGASRLDQFSGSEHTYGSRDGCTKICHFNPGMWKDENTLYQVTMKGLIWLEAYEAHLRTGNSLSQYLREMKM